MGVMINWEDKTLMDSSNSIFAGLYSSMLDVINEDNLFFNKEISKLIDRLELCCDGWNVDLAKYIKTKNDFVEFIYLLRKSIDKRYKDIPGLPQQTVNRFENFYKGLREIQNIKYP